MMEITSRDNPQVKRVRRLLDDRAFRHKEAAFVCEGPVMLREALSCGCAVEAVFSLEELAGSLPQLQAPVFRVSRPVLEKMTDVKAPQGLVFTCKLPQDPPPLSGGRLIAVEALRDPGNAGTILRTADALGMDGVVFLGDCVDPYGPKVVRATMGSLFRMPPRRMTAAEFCGLCKELGLPLYGAALTPQAVPVTQLDLGRCAVVIGSEAHGLSPELLSQCDMPVIIPISGAESLNAAVAAAILMWEMVRE